YLAREAIRNNGHTMEFSNNRITSACLDPNLINLRPGALDNGTPRYPNTPTFLHAGYIIMDPNGNIEQVIGNAGTSDATAPDWSVELGGTTVGDELTWENMGPWNVDNSPLSYWALPSLVTGRCYSVFDQGGGGNTWSANEVGYEPGVDGLSYPRGSYFIDGAPSSITGNICGGDLPDLYGNGQCWWGGDLYSNGGPANLAPNGERVNASGGGTAWVGDYSVVVLNDNIPRHYNDFQGMAEGQTFSVTSSTAANVIDPWGITGSNWNIPGPGSLYGHPSLMTCTGGPLVVTPGSYYDFYYHLGSTDYAVRQINCPSGANSGLSILPGSVSFPSQIDGTTSAAQTVTVTNISGTALNVLLAASDDFSQSSTCGGTIAVAASCTISVTFTPTTVGAHVGVLTITPNGSYSSQTVSLSGVGTAPSNASQASTIAISSSVATLEVSPTVQSAKTLVTVTPQGGFVGTVNLKCAVISEAQTVQATSPTCSFSPAQVGISSTTAGVSTLVISIATPSVATTIQRNPCYRGVSLAGLGLLGLLPLAMFRRKTFITLLSIVLLAVMVGCGYTPNTSTSSYKVVITATSGTQANTSISIPLNVQVQPAL
ncbi:MAG TPA: choice-of-anchor D domain-containing protein, partial [Acidobacteriaceae bacterium]|nr:choice-of-anchor D domain-containing protein [Acidobacteriaceae bacterium]